MSKKSAMSGLGRAIIKDRFKGYHRTDASWLHTTDLDDGSDYNKINLRSVTEESTLEEFLRTAELANKQFTAEKLNIKLLTSTPGLPSKDDEKKLREMHEKFKDQLKIPRRPHWDKNTTPEELDQKEKEAFLDWRRSLAFLAENNGLTLTPYERNIEVWRQLWRVIEKSDAVVQIVDARNPLFFRCQDLEHYVREVNQDKQNILLLNKADFLTYEQRKAWAKYFDEQGVTAVFWSAAAELSRLKGEEVNTNDSEAVQGNNEDDGNTKNNPKVLNVDELLDMLHTFPLQSYVKEGLRTFGLVGYPNVGKSSTINALLSRKEQIMAEKNEKTKHLQAPVSATPGKTKHFQTFFLDESLMLCDCPGLVMPTFVSTKAVMITSGVLPIDQMTDCIPPSAIICEHIPRDVLESTYGIMLPVPTEEVYPDRNPTPHELLSAYARIRGFMSHKGIPDVQRASRLILKDYVNGKLCYCHSPPGLSEEEYGSKPSVVKGKDKDNSTENDSETGQQAVKPFYDPILSEQIPSSGLRGTFRSGGQTQKPAGDNRTTKRHGNANKKEKLRRTFGHLDA